MHIKYTEYRNLKTTLLCVYVYIHTVYVYIYTYIRKVFYNTQNMLISAYVRAHTHPFAFGKTT